MTQRTLILLGRSLIFILAFFVALISTRYWHLDVIDLLLSKSEETLSNIFWQFSFYGHVFLGPLALVIGPFQFLPKFRAQRMNLHRNIGKVYIIACLLSGIAGLGAAHWATGGNMNQLGFSLLAACWLYTTTKAYLAIRQKDIKAHHIWMVRSYALTFSAVTLRIYLGMFQVLFEMPFPDAYEIVAWAAWIPNLLAVEVWWRLFRGER